VLDAYAGAESREDSWFFVYMIFRDENRDWLADHFVGGVAEDALRSGVPARDDAFERFADDGIIRGINQGGEPIRSQFRTLKIRELLS
jgi:hypothetical protein